MPTVITSNWKSVLAFVALIVTNLLAVVVNSSTGAVLPQTTTQWLTAMSTTVVGTIAVWVKSNGAATPKTS